MACNCIGGNPCPCQGGQWAIGRITFGPDSWKASTLPTSADLADLLAKAKLRTMTPKEEYEQRVSWVMGMVPFDREITREEVVKHLAEMGVVDPAHAPVEQSHR